MDEKRPPGRPRKTQEQIETTQEHIGQEGNVRVDTGKLLKNGAVERRHSDVVDVVTGPDAMKKADRLAFNEEFMEVMVMTTTDKTQVPLPQISVNGRNQFFIRGKPMRVRRKFVGVLAGAKKTSFAPTNEINPKTGNVVQLMNPTSALQYPFTVIRDENPHGAEWLRSLLAAAG